MTALYSLALFVGAALLFALEPMVGKFLLPPLGSTPSVWNTTVLFFQATLLAGYLYSHLTSRLRAQKVVHIAVLAVGFVSLDPNDLFECEAWARGFRRVAGVDEAGRGPLAGPVVAAAVILPRRYRLAGLRDSKLLSEAQREHLYGQLLAGALDIGVGVVEAEVIDAVNILEATRLAMAQAVQHLTPPPDYLLLDAVILPSLPIEQRAVIKGDRLSLSIAAASVVAKVLRDRLMARAHVCYPQYGFLAHKGYGTAEHLRQLARYGPCKLHRRSFRPVVEGAGGHDGA